MVLRWDLRFIALAHEVSNWSKDPSTKCGAVLVGPENSVVSVGFNGFPKGMCDDSLLYENREEKYSRIIHAEINALLFANQKIEKGSSLYTVPFMPCDRCVVQMLQAGIRRFVAPKCVDPDKLARWGNIFEKTKKYIHECGGELIEVTYD